MTAIERVRRARAALLGALTASALLHAAAAFALVLGLAALLDAATQASLSIRKAVVPLALLGATVAAAVRLWRGRGALGLTGVALFIEEQTPGLQYALVTAVEPAGHRDASLLDRAVEQSWSSAALHSPIRRALIPPLLVGVVLLGALAVLPRAALSRILDPRAGDALLAPRGLGAPESRLTTLVVVVTPPRTVVVVAPGPARARSGPTTMTTLAWVDSAAGGGVGTAVIGVGARARADWRALASRSNSLVT